MLQSGTPRPPPTGVVCPTGRAARGGARLGVVLPGLLEVVLDLLLVDALGDASLCRHVEGVRVPQICLLLHAGPPAIAAW